MHACHVHGMAQLGYNCSNEVHDELVPVDGSLDNSHDQHEGGDQDHHPEGVAEIPSSWIVTA